MAKRMTAILTLLLLGAGTLGAAEAVFYPVESAAPGEWFLRSVVPGRKKYEKHYLDRLDKLAPPERRAAFADALLRTLDELSVSNREEDAAIEKALDWRPGDFTFHNSRFYWRTGCTSWMVMPDASETGAAMLQKNRDYHGQNLLSIRIFRAMPGRYKVVTVGDLWNSGAGAVMNEKGLMIVQNDGPGGEPALTRFGVNCVYVLRLLAEKCASAAEAEAMLRELHARGVVRGASIYLIADPDRGFVVEVTSRRFAAAEVNFGFEARANNFLLPGMASFKGTVRSREDFLNGENRRYTATTFFASRLREKGSLSPRDLMDCSRLRDPEAEKNKWRQICMKHTIASTLFVPDRAYPEMLSTTFIAVGPPRHAVYLPVPMGVTEFPEELADGDMGLLAFALREKYGLDHEHLGRFEALERELMDEHCAAREKARKLLRDNRRTEAAELLTGNFRRQFLRVREFMTGELERAQSAK